MGVLKEKLVLEEFIAYSTNNNSIRLSKKQKENVKRASKKIDQIVKEEKPVYGINTGFGALCNEPIKKENLKKLQKNLIKSHACGTGKPLTKPETKGTMLLLINSLSKGHSGIKLRTLNTLIEMYNKEVLPIIPEKGSLGASGDLIPLAHLALVLIGEGYAKYKGKKYPGKTAMAKAGITPVTLSPKEGLALINGTHAITAVSALNIYYSLQLSKTSDISSAMSFEALKGLPDSLDSRIHNQKPHIGQKIIAENLRRIIKNSELAKASEIVQDPYSLRCASQIQGPNKDFQKCIKEVIETEMNSVTDNPLIFETGCLSGGNFHGQYIATAMDILSILLPTLASVSGIRTGRLLNSSLSGMSPFLAKERGLNSGLMIPQYLSAALESKNKVLAYPASITSLPVSANQEDHVSMAMTSALKAREIVENTEYVIAIELLCAAQALEFHKEKPGEGTQIAYQTIRKHIPTLKEDRVMNKDIETMYQLVHEGIILKEVEKEIGCLK